MQRVHIPTKLPFCIPPLLVGMYVVDASAASIDPPVESGLISTNGQGDLQKVEEGAGRSRSVGGRKAKYVRPSLRKKAEQGCQTDMNVSCGMKSLSIKLQIQFFSAFFCL